MKTVYTSDMVCHLWANMHAHEVRTSSGNLYTKNGALYSYGRHHIIGAFLPAVPPFAAPLLLLNANTYSATTAKHASKARRALPPGLFENAVTVPNLFEGNVSDLPTLARDCIAAAVPALDRCEKARENLPVHLNAARTWFDSARRLFERAGDKKAAARVPVLAPDAGKPEAAATLLAMMRETYSETVKKETAFAVAVAASLSPESPTLDAVRIMGTVTMGQNHAKKAREHVARAGLKRVPAALTKAEKALAALAAKWQGPADAQHARQAAADISLMLATLRDELKEDRKVKKQGRGNAAVSWALGRLEASAPKTLNAHTAAMWGEDAPARLAELQQVIRRARAVDAARVMFQVLDRTCANIAAYLEGDRYANTPDGASLRQRVAMWESCPAYWAQQAHAVADQADALKAKHAERVARENAERIAAWREGGRVSLPRDVGPLVRIIGTTLQTSWGAEVPLEHAARLLKIARRVHAEGGKVYAQNDGPTVGHFRVNSIASDFSMVIGCHPFTAAECEHAAALIDAAAVTAEEV